jgi:hypothetical protein
VILAVFAVAFRHSYRVGRITLLSVCFTWFMTLTVMAAFAFYAGSLSQADREQWALSFPDGQNVLGIMVFGWMNGLFVAGAAVGIRRIIRKERLFRFSKMGAQNEKPDT